MDKPRRECGGCTACCFLLEVPDVPKPSFEACPHQRDGVGCAIYEKRPKPCANFGCLWIEGQAPMFTDDVSDRPDKLGMAFFLAPRKIVPGRPTVFAYELREDAAIQPRVRELVDAMGTTRPVMLVQHETRASIIRYPDDIRGRAKGGTVGILDDNVHG